jgi:Zinc finger, C3HC4 type (RING finger)
MVSLPSPGRQALVQYQRYYLQDVSSMIRSPSPPMNQSYVHPIWGGAASAVVGAERTTTSRPEPPSRASTSLSTSISDIASEICHSPPSTGTFTPSPSSLSTSSLNTFHTQHLNNLPVQFPQSGRLPTQLPTNTTFPAYAFGVVGLPSVAAHASPTVPTSPLTSSHSSSPSPPLSVQQPPAGPATPVRRSAHPRSRLQSHSQAEPQPQSQPHASEPKPPSSSRSKLSVAETPSGDLANFHLLNGSPLQSVVDIDTPTPSPRTPSMLSVSPAGVQAFALTPYSGDSLPLIADRRVLPPSSISPSVARAQRAITKSGAFRSPFYCRVCQTDPCREITATVCGHLFCNACIMEEVRENARCPVCNAAVLLFALLKLDISS